MPQLQVLGNISENSKAANLGKALSDFITNYVNTKEAITKRKAESELQRSLLADKLTEWAANRESREQIANLNREARTGDVTRKLEQQQTQFEDTQAYKYDALQQQGDIAAQTSADRQAALESREAMNVEDNAVKREIAKERAAKDFAKFDFDKRQKTYDAITKNMSRLSSEDQNKIKTSPQFQALSESLGIPVYDVTVQGMGTKSNNTGGSASMEKWKALNASVAADLERGVGTYPTPIPNVTEQRQITSEAQAREYLSMKGLDPAAFEIPLARYRSKSVDRGMSKRSNSPYKEYPDAFQDKDGKWKVIRGGQKYKIEE